MQREVRLPSCLQFCVELCGGKKCQNKCNKVLRFGQLWIKVTDVIFIVATQWWLQPGQAQSGQPGLQQVERGGAPIPSRICEVWKGDSGDLRKRETFSKVKGVWKLYNIYFTYYQDGKELLHIKFWKVPRRDRAKVPGVCSPCHDPVVRQVRYRVSTTKYLLKTLLSFIYFQLKNPWSIMSSCHHVRTSRSALQTKIYCNLQGQQDWVLGTLVCKCQGCKDRCWFRRKHPNCLQTWDGCSVLSPYWGDCLIV